MTAALMGVAAVMIHALADFPIHVVSTSATAILLLAAWGDCGRIERGETAPAPPMEARTLPRASPKTVRAVATAAAILIAPAAVGAGAWFYSLLHASMYESLGTSYRIYYGDHYNEMSGDERYFVIGEAYRTLKRGQKISPLDGQIAFRLGEVCALYGVLDVTEAEQIHAANDPTSRALEQARRQDADLRLFQAVQWLERRCQTEVRYHEVFYYLGMAYENLFRLHGMEDDRQKAKLYYRLAVRYSPCFSRSLYRLFVILQKDNPPNVAELREVVRQIAHFDPAMFQRQFTQAVQKAMDRRDYEQAAAKIDVLLDVEPNRTDLWLTKAHLSVCVGRSRETEAVLAEFVRRFPTFPPNLLTAYRAEAAAASGRYEEAVNLMTLLIAAPEHAGLVPYYRCLRAAALGKMNRPEAQSEWAEIERLGQTDPQYQNAAADVFLFVVRDLDRAYSCVLKRCQSEPTAPASFFRIAAEMSFRRGEKERAVQCLERALELDPDDPLAQQLLKTFRL
jgi:tetratricopeptide (TPR) repeat protein